MTGGPIARAPAFAGVVLAAAFAVVSAALATGLPGALDLPVRDALLRAFPSRPVTGVAVVAVDEASLAAEGPWPWPRARLAAVVDGVRASGARAIALDVLLVEPGEGDPLLASSLARLPSVLAAGLDAKAGWLLPAPALRDAGTTAHVSFDVDHDGVVRRFGTTKQRDGLSLPALPVAAASLAAPAIPPLPVGRVLVPAFRRRPGGVPVVGASDLLAGRTGETLRGRVAFLGVTAAGLGDRYVSPGSAAGRPEPGVLVQAAAAASVLSGELLQGVPPLASGLLAAAFAGLVLLAGRGARRRPLRVSAALLPPAGGAALLLAGLELPVATLTLSTLLVLLAVEARAARRGEDEVARAARLRAEEREARRAAVHDLKTPLTAVRGLTQLLSGFDLSEEERARVVAMVGEETDRLGGMIESLNAVEKMRLADFDAAARPVDLGALAARRAAALGAGGRVSAASPERVVVLGDAALLSRVVDNLLGNALKFSPPGAPVRIAVAFRGGEALLTVADEGPGIPEGEREKVFGRFTRGRGAERVEGLGLGLSLVSEVVTWHRGRVSVRSTGGTGSLFEVALPAFRGAPGEEEGEPGHDPGR